MNYKEKLLNILSSNEEYSLSDAEKIVNNLEYDLFLNGLTIEGNSILFEILTKNKNDLNSAFYNKFKGLIHKDIILTSKEDGDVKLDDLVFKLSGIDLSLVKQRNDSLYLYLNDLNIIGDGHFVFSGVENVVSLNDLFEKIVKNNLNNLFLKYFSVLDEHYEYVFLSLINTAYTLENIKKVINHFDADLEVLLKKIHLPKNKECHFKNFKEKKYLDLIMENPEFIRHFIKKIDAVKYIFSLMKENDKKCFLKNLGQPGLKKSNLRLTAFTLHDQKKTVLYAIRVNEIKFLNTLVEFGYDFSDYEKTAIKEEKIQDELDNFEDTIHLEFNKKFTELNDEESKFKYLLKSLVDKKIALEDFNRIIFCIDICKLNIDTCNFNYSLKYNLSDIYKYYTKGEFSAIDCLLNLGSVKSLLKLDLNKLTPLQKSFFEKNLSNKAVYDFCEEMTNESVRKNQLKNNFLINYYERIYNEINDSFIKDIYTKILIKDGEIDIYVDEYLSSLIKDQELINNKDFLISSSFYMFNKYIKMNENIDEINLKKLPKLIQKSINSLNYYKTPAANKETTGNDFMNELRNNDFYTKEILEKVKLNKDLGDLEKEFISILESKKINSHLTGAITHSEKKERKRI